ncbi:MAG: glycosyltransferase, partial [Elusimicrobia bacterium]|nr:glycosyltransferase [Elusimicrobiota bacterium]
MSERKLQILLLTPWAPIPTDAGSRRVWTACRLLKGRYDFHLLTFLRPDGEDPKQSAAAMLGQEKLYFPGLFQSIRNVALPSSYHPCTEEGLELPREIAGFYSPDMSLAVKKAIRELQPDLVHIEFDLMAPYVRAAKSEAPALPCILTHHDLSALSLFSSYFREMSGWKKWRRLGDWRRRLTATRDLCRRFDAVITVSESDRRRMGRWIPVERVFSVPTGVDLEHFSGGLPRSEREPDSLVYVGHYPHYPNEEAVLRFAAQTWPLIKAARPKARFYVVGSGPTKKIFELSEKDPSIIVTGTVPDVKPYEARAMALIAPLKLGYGIKGKILEALAMGTPVVSSSSANEAIGAADGRHLLLADS